MENKAILYLSYLLEGKKIFKVRNDLRSCQRKKERRPQGKNHIKALLYDTLMMQRFKAGSSRFFQVDNTDCKNY